MFWKDNEDRINIPPAHPWNDEVANDVVVKKGQITVRGPGFLENNGSAAPEILSAGINGNWKVETARAIFLPESEVIEEQGKLEIRWVIFPRNWQLPDSKIQLYGRLYPSGSDNAEWNLVALYELSHNPDNLVNKDQNTTYPESAGDDVMPQGLRYSILYDQLLRLEHQGKFLEALRMIPKIYAADIPVDSFYVTLENKRRQLIDAVVQQKISFRIGREKSTCSGILELFTDLYIGKPDSYRFLIPVSDDLEYDRFCYLLIAEGHLQQTSSEDLLLLPSSSRFSLQSALDSADPWLVSAAIFFSRKQKTPTISPQAIIDRWERRPDLWDEQCTQQALLFLAQLDAKAYKKLQVSNEDIQMKLAELQPVPNDKSYLFPLLFSSIGGPLSYINSPGIMLVKLREKKEKGGVIKRWAGDINHYSSLEQVMEKKITATDLKDGAITVEPGVYKILFNSVYGSPPSGYYGKSGIVEVKQGELVVIPIHLVPAI